ncbi:hypothetical protein SAMN05421747_101187 [Parapedobacter composti]|uniref:Tetratricopeptide repeat-containing protein n=1 Tax=Parapedobacter composti TaxID=623281 RepID=A0A1I1E524_9SPHI|nr:hypothetical protein [Parapedobacter composti]SFB79963.1 hypothetical protein SAMN05421747_101187 [Parapedobacter composti]
MKVKQGLHSYAVWLCFFFCGSSLGLVAQPNADFSGQITKFDSTFAGIGPPVYFLPPPKSEEELLDDRYAAKEVDSAVVEEYVDRMKYYHRLKITGDRAVMAKYLPVTVSQASSVEGRLLTEIGQMERRGGTDALADLQNRLAMEYVAVGACDFAMEFFNKAMATKAQVNRVADRDAIAHNLAVIYEYTGELAKARNLRQEMYDRAMRSGNNAQQAYALMELALVKAKEGFSLEAERDIIRKVVPLFRRARDEVGRATAYRTLADIYTLQRRYPEAQWFLVQAKSIVDKEGLSELLPEIIFNLAETKKHSGNPRVAIEEYKVADDLARKDNMIGMQLAIQDALGNLYHQAGDYEGAALALNRYDTLKNILFRGTGAVAN